MKRLSIIFIIVLTTMVSAGAYHSEKKLVEADELRKLTATIDDSTVDVQCGYYKALYKAEAAKNKSLSAKISLMALVFLIILVSTVLVVRSKMKMRGIDSVRCIAELFMVSTELQENACRKEMATVCQEPAVRIAGEITVSDFETGNAKIKISRLFRERWSELNILCNEYFDMGDSPNARLSVVHNIERELEKMRTPKNIRLIVDSVNLYMDDIVSRLEKECPFLKPEDLTFLALVFARFSPRAVCMFTGIKLKYYYNKRSRLAARIRRVLGENAEPYMRLFNANVEA